jgi:hypothetical protein
MATTDDELRQHLLATIEAAPELDQESRAELADVFLRELNSRYDLVPRGSTNTRWAERHPVPRGAWAPPVTPFFPFWLVIPVLFALSFVFHLPFFLFAIVLFFAFRAGRHGGWRRRRTFYL